MEKIRCDWANGHELDEQYHDDEWGRAEHNEQKLFEMLLLESMQAGLSWSTILKKRETLTKAYDQFDYTKIAEYQQEKIDSLLEDPGIIRNKLKVKAAINNAKVFMQIQEEYGSFDQFIWAYVDGKPIKNRWATISEVPTSTELSDKISKDLKKKGFKFLGTTTVYAFMQATGMVDDHLAYCFRSHEA
ncbi:DNA-3-methyladenine glycosylase I [Enterococcus moraviensis ATCC BAA-383]|uniref:DNA-3-methyladenine glycosylase I n=1 Tax=Enterococcus moraviensis ATCC BAA-383 TaxID=1158609 RepID=R2RCQ9_9ENTE|nr:DNA-3-methyladenine glycosylase I [Enterococcus moraviensis]EOI06815.1 DNA-3-methyladenine glycosylase I [Enterococcus moraviensis ATCC BAA-383]EOT65158.1 DNA-3-methyladenine glycosylase I [Enterococcus moraviensis ATCC BAA-383]